jgi:hypothetical protein
MKKLALVCIALAALFGTQQSALAGGPIGIHATPPHPGGHFPGSHGRPGHFSGHYSGSNWGIYLGLPLLFPWIYYSPPPVYSYPAPPYGYPAPAYSYPAPGYVEPDAPVYVEKGTQYRWYCRDPDGYFPNVQTCDAPWEREEEERMPAPFGAPGAPAQ